jgi:hypothetical protein
MARRSVDVRDNTGFAVFLSLAFCALVASICCGAPTVAFGQIAFGPPTDYPVGGPSAQIVATDLNGDGYPDLVVSNNSGTAIFVLLNQGNGTFGTATQIPFSFPGGIATVVATDLNGDGHVDIVVGGNVNVGNGWSGFYVLISNGDGSFRTPVLYSDPVAQEWVNGVAVGDFFGDGRVDVADHLVGLFGADGGFHLWRNRGDGTFTLVTSQPFAYQGIGSGPSTADTNGDGLLDLIGPSSSNCNGWACYVAVLLGEGDDTFAPAVNYSTNGAVYVVGDISSSTGRPDGFPDVVGSNGAPQIFETLNNGDGAGTFAPPVSYNIVSTGPVWIAIADFDGDGRPDLAALEPDGLGHSFVDILIGEKNAGGFFVGSGNGDYAGLGIDLNGDGLADIVSTDQIHNSIHVLLNQSTPVGNSSPIQFSPPRLTFPPLTISKTSIVRTITLSYTSGTGLLNISNVSVSGDFALAKNNCPARLAAGGSCTFSLTFTPAATGTRTGTLIVTDNQTGSPHTLTLTGTGKDPAITFSPKRLTFAGQLLGTTSSSKTAKVINSGIGDLVITSVSASGNFAITSDICTRTTVPQGKSCTFGVSFTPSVAVVLAGEITITDDGRTSPQVLSLSGTGLNPFSVSPASLAFGTVAVGSSSLPKSVTVMNNSPNTVGFNIPASGDYSATGGGSNPCGTSLPANSQCTISVTFTPKQNGSIPGGLLIYTTTQYHQTLAVALSGTGSGGVGTGPLKFSPSALTFPNQVIGTASAPQTVTVTNSISRTVNISSFPAFYPEFQSSGSGTNPCGGPLLGHSRCTFNVTFGSPEGTDTIKGSVVVTTDNAVSPQIYGLSGTGVLPVTIAPASLIFAPQTVGTTTNPQTLTITNNQSATLNITSIVASGQYTAVPAGTAACGNTLAALGQCTMAVTFSPATTGSISGVVTVTHDALGSPQEIKLTGVGQ